MKTIFFIVLLTVFYMELCSSNPKKKKTTEPEQPQTINLLDDSPKEKELIVQRSEAMRKFSLWLLDRGGVRIADKYVIEDLNVDDTIVINNFGFHIAGKDETRSILVNIWFQWKPGMNPNGNQTHIMVNDLECGKGKPEDAIRRGVSHVYYHGILNCVEYDSKQPLASNPTFLIPQRSIPTYSYHIDDLEFEVIVTTYIEVSRQLYRVDISREGMLRDSICYAVIAGLKTLKIIHSKSIILRNVDPFNIHFQYRFLVITDFSLACHRDKCDSKPCGDVNYNPPNGQFGHRQSEADDVFGLFLSIISKFITVPWIGERDSNYILSVKESGMKDLCTNMDKRYNLGQSFTAAWTHLRPLMEAGKRPDYIYLAKLFRRALFGDNLIDENKKFIWIGDLEEIGYGSTEQISFSDIKNVTVAPIPQMPKPSLQPKPIIAVKKKGVFSRICKR